jgi:hypothetical protein
MDPSDPQPRDAAAVAAEVLGAPAASVRRFPTGLAHFVYDVRLADGRSAVIRMSRRADLAAARGAVYWSSLLRPIGVPPPALLHSDLSLARWPFPLLVLERLSGDDLGIVYRQLGRGELRSLAERLAAVQAIVAALPPGGGYGFAPSLEGPFAQPRWADVVAALLARSRMRIRNAGVVDEGLADPIERAVERLTGYFAGIAPVPFLHDITIKNVIVQAGQLSGIVDVDDLCFGDPLLLIALIRMALLADDLDPFYVEQWIEIVRPDAGQAAAIDLYTALYCLDFIGELGQRFNRPAPEPVDAARLERLRTELVELSQRSAFG